LVANLLACASSLLAS